MQGFLYRIRRRSVSARRIAPVLLASFVALAIAATPVWARGNQESAGATTTTGSTAPAARADAVPAEAQRVPMDGDTAAVLARLGITPFREKIPSEDFRLDLLGGGDSTLFEHQGKVIFLNFWATWCPPCREEMPSMEALYNELQGEGLEILAVNVLESADTAKAFVDEYRFTFPIVLDVSGRVMSRYGVRAYPTTYIIDREGRVLGVRAGYQNWSDPEIVDALRDLLAS